MYRTCHLIRSYHTTQCSYEAQPVQLSALLLASGIDVAANHYNISLFSPTLYLPRYPSQSVCLDYSAKCASLIDVAQQPALFPECNASVSHSAAVKKFPTFSQIVDTVSLPLTPLNTFLPLRSVEIALRSDPNNFTQANDPGYRTICPEGMYVRTYALTRECQPVTSLHFALHCYTLRQQYMLQKITNPIQSNPIQSPSCCSTYVRCNIC